MDPTALINEEGVAESVLATPPPQVSPNGGVPTETIQSIKLSYGGPYSNFSPDGKGSSLRYPCDPHMIQEDSDYVAFRFYKYAPPFKDRKQVTFREQLPASSNRVPQSFTGFDYNQAAGGAGDATYKRNNMQDVILYMPDDISTGYKSNWQGKAFSNIATGAMRAIGNGNQQFENAGTALKNVIESGIPIAGNIALARLIGSITGDQITADDLFSSTSGAILNPNVELLFGGVDLRNFSLTYKLVPRSAKESTAINAIIKSFKLAMLPSITPGAINGFNEEDKKIQGINNSFIGLPDLCQVVFMKGAKRHERLPRFKMCAITDVSVNYTPDGSYATYGDGQPVAIELSLTFQETKMVFREDVAQGF